MTLSVIVCAMATSPFYSQDQKLPIDPGVRTGQLDNGLKYFIAHNAKPEDRAELRLALRAGSMQEDEDQLGVAHFVEHMAFNGSEHFSKNELVDYLESVGTRFGPDLNAYTSFDETVYMLQVRTDDEEQLDKGLLVLQDWAGGIAFDDEEIDKERGVVVSEWRSRLSADQRMQQEYFPKMLYNSRYADRLPIGDPDIIENGSYDIFKRFYRDWYRPDLMAVIVIGDIDVDAMEQEVIDRFSGLSNPAVVREREEYDVPMHDETLVSVCTDKEASFTNIRIMYKHPETTTSTEADYRRNLVQLLYNGMLNARLYELNSVPDPPFVFAGSGYGSSIGNMDTYSSYAMAPEGGAIRSFEVMLTENKRAAEHGFVETELEREKAEMMRRIETAFREKDKTESNRKARQIVNHYLNDSPLMSPEQTIGLYRKYLDGITIDEVNALGSKWIRDESRVIIYTGPDKEGVSTPTEAELLEVLAKVESTTVEPYVDEVSDQPLFAGELSPVEITDHGALDALDIHYFTLANGIEVMYKQTDFKNDEILMAAYSNGGHSLYPDDKYQSARAAISIMRESGIGDFTPPQLDKLMAGKAGIRRAHAL